VISTWNEEVSAVAGVFTSHLPIPGLNFHKSDDENPTPNPSLIICSVSILASHRFVSKGFFKAVSRSRLDLFFCGTNTLA
jgi:hypothetical protein